MIPRPRKAFTMLAVAVWLALFLLSLASALRGAAAQSRLELVDGDRIVIIDGDTIALPCEPSLGLCRSERIRILNIDAPETGRARCEAERIAGLAAKEALARHLRGRSITITRCEPETGRCEDRYRRTLARLSTPAGDIGAALVASGHALPWRPGPDAARARAQHWCGR